MDQKRRRCGPTLPGRARIAVYLEFSGTQVGLVGLDPSGADFGRIPVDWTALQVKETPGWVKILRAPRAGENAERGTHYELLDQAGWAPAQVKYVTKEGKTMIALANDTPREACADYIVLSNYVLPIDVHACEEPPELADVATPVTPSPSPSSP